MIEFFLIFVKQYLYVPPAIFVVLTIAVYIMWLFGTDWYDNFRKFWGDHSIGFMKFFFWWLLIINFIGLITETIIYLQAAFNIWCILVLVLYSIRLTVHTLNSFNKWCLQKRGKK